jgi:diguanylate cyclase (GGDEF)-like protein
LITREEAARLKDQLLQLLAEDTHNSERLTSRLDALTRETGVGAHAALLLILTQLAFDETEAASHWDGILEHRHGLSLALGRDAGLRVAVLDYFVNVNRRLMQPNLIDVAMRRSSLATGADPVTGLSSDREFRSALSAEVRRAKRYEHRVSVALFDLDGFAAVNEAVGSIVGDRLLREAAIVLGGKIRDIDHASRPGDDEFSMLLPQTDRNGAFLVAERFRRELEAHFRKREAAGRPVGLTISGGVAAYPDDALDAESLMTQAAQALYQAKAAGKNVIVVHSPERRRFLRFDLRARRCEIEVLAPGDAGAARPRNLSRSGLLVASPEPLEVGEDVELRLESGASESPRRVMTVRGRVVRLEEVPSGENDRFEIGIAFDLEAGRGESELLEFLEVAGPERGTE